MAANFFPAARRATGCRVKIRIPGETGPRVFGSSADDQATLTGLTDMRAGFPGNRNLRSQYRFD